ncbi:MAG: ABC transporter substrate-binding protein [Acidimicrobiales bacterium]
MRIRLAALALAGLAATTTLAACGSSSSSSGSSSSASSASGSSSSSSGSSSSDKSGAGKTITFGAVVSLTGGGGVYGPQQKNAIQLAVDTVNSHGGVNGAQIKVDIQDDASDKAQAAQTTQRLIQEDNATAILGPTLSNSAVAAHPIAASAHTPMLAVSTTGFNIVGPGCTYCAGWIFRDSLGEQDAIPANIKAYADKAHPKTAALLYPNDDKFSADGAQVVKDNASKFGIELKAAIQFTKAETDLTPYVTQAVSSKPDVIFITSLGGIPAKIMKAARQQGFTGQFLGGNGFNTAAVSTQAGADGKGAQSASGWFIGNTFPSNADYVSAYKAKYNADPDQFSAQAYSGVLILVDAAKRAHLSFTDIAGDRTKLRSALETTDIETPLGKFSFTKDHDVHQTIWIIAMNGSGGFDLVTKVDPS